MKKIADTLEISRSNQYARGKNQRGRYNPKPDDEKYLSHIRKVTDARPSYGYRRVTAQINREISERVNHKRIYRIMRIHHLLLPATCVGVPTALRYSAGMVTRSGLPLPWIAQTGR
jgi:putative transposase